MAWAPLAITVGGAILSAVGQYSQGRAARRYGEQVQAAKAFEAAQMEQNAGQEIAASQRQAIEQRRRASLVASRAMAVSAASGAGASDPTIENIISDIAGEGAYRSGIALYQGEERARQLRMGASGALFEGEQAAQYGRQQGRAANIGAFASLASAGGSLYAKYGMGGPKTNPQAGSLDSYELFSGRGMTDPRFG